MHLLRAVRRRPLRRLLHRLFAAGDHHLLRGVNIRQVAVAQQRFDIALAQAGNRGQTIA